jgi:hypothetical protein
MRTSGGCDAGSLELGGGDHTNFFRGLADALERGERFDGASAGAELTGPSHGADQSAVAQIPRNHLVDAALESGEAGDLEPTARALVVQHFAAPYVETDANVAFSCRRGRRKPSRRRFADEFSVTFPARTKLVGNIESLAPHLMSANEPRSTNLRVTS